MNNLLLKIENLEASINNKKILKKFNLEIKENEIHVIMGPNGSGKSTLSKILAGHPAYEIKKGTIEFSKQDLLEMSAEVRAHEGLFLAFQYPIEIAGVTNYDFLRIAYNEKQKYCKNTFNWLNKFNEIKKLLMLHENEEFNQVMFERINEKDYDIALKTYRISH